MNSADVVEIRLDNIRAVADWLRSSGWAVAGLSMRASGRVADRGLWVGTLEGDVLHARIGDRISAGPQGLQILTT